MRAEQTVAFRFVCVDMPGTTFQEHTDLRLGIQEKREVIHDVPADTEGASFAFSLRVREQSDSGDPNFLGAHAQGSPRDRFVYLCWGTRADGIWHPLRRAKIPLYHITWEQVNAALNAEQPITATIRMTNARGEPVAASVQPDAIAWTL